jgi:hypothetical protein
MYSLAFRPVRSLQDTVEIASRELAPQYPVQFMLRIHELCVDITDAANDQVVCQSNIAERNIHWKQLRFK